MSDTPWTPDRLREAWMAFFTERQHAAHPSASLVPENDPTLLFTGAGMNQFKDMFLGKGNLPFKRAATIQKCFRQGDLENVGRTPRHLTFFEMLGHFSFGDYFKADAIPWAWSFLTEVLGIPADKLYVSVYEEDDEAYEAWRKAGVAEAHIARFDAKENFWPADAPKKGPNGPCGPCSEIFYDYGPSREVGDGSDQEYDSGRYIEIWNTVFTQYERVGEDQLEPLPQRNIDCGAGFERIVAVLEGEYSPFGTSLFRPLLTAVSEIANKPYDFAEGDGLPTGEDARRMRRISEHVRAACMLIGDGVRPGNEGRGYVLRRILRRAIRDGIGLGIDRPFLTELVAPVIEVMGRAYPALVEGRTTLEGVLGTEEQRFRETYANGLKYLDEELKQLDGAKVLPGPAAFKLYDTYGFPVDLAEIILEERGISVDLAGFEAEMEAQRERARAGSRIEARIFAGGPLTELKAGGAQPTTFHGYESELEAARVIGIVAGESLVDVATPDSGEVQIVLAATPFYAESGGQVGDAGLLEGAGLKVRIDDTQNTEGFHVHRGVVLEGSLHTGDEVQARVDTARRAAIRRNHTATHLMHKVLKDVLGAHVQQEGSLVDAERLRFDFRHEGALSESQIREIEDRVNRWVVQNQSVGTEVMDIESARASGAVAMFGEKYSDVVRVLDIPGAELGTSRELCGGTHCVRTGDIGSFRITLETSVAAGIRRIEAVTGLGAVASFERDREVLSALSRLLKVKPEETLDRVEGLMGEIKTLRKEKEQAQREAGAAAAGRLVEAAETIGALRVVLASLDGVDAKGLRGVWDTLRKGGVNVALLIGEQGPKAPLLAAADKAAVAAGADASALLKAATGVLGGGGGGKAPLAQGMGQKRDQAEAGLAAARELLSGALSAT